MTRVLLYKLKITNDCSYYTSLWEERIQKNLVFKKSSIEKWEKTRYNEKETFWRKPEQERIITWSRQVR